MNREFSGKARAEKEERFGEIRGHLVQGIEGTGKKAARPVRERGRFDLYSPDLGGGGGPPGRQEIFRDNPSPGFECLSTGTEGCSGDPVAGTEHTPLKARPLGPSILKSGGRKGWAKGSISGQGRSRPGIEP